jgi:hypothetical protein
MEPPPGDFEWRFSIINFATWGMRTDHLDLVKKLLAHMNRLGTRHLQIAASAGGNAAWIKAASRGHQGRRADDRWRRLAGRIAPPAPA